ncbi:MAG: tetratricopeptide repeat protein [Deltaproteobacteria bacterium]|nr:tetratricopeptide repeat protein [Deltaproteobacteria bacterium]
MDSKKEKTNITGVAKSWFGKLKSTLQKSGKPKTLRDLEVKAAENPKDLRIKLQLGREYFKKQDVLNGIALYREVGEKYIEDNFSLKAIAVYKEILKYSPRSVEFNEKLGDLFLKMHMHHDAGQQYQIAAHYYQSHQDLDEAIRLTQKLLTARPKEVTPRMHLAELYFLKGDEESSLKEYERLAFNLRKEKKDWTSLAEVYEKILYRRPAERSLLKELCVFYLKLNKPAKALLKIEKYNLTKDEAFKPIYKKALEMKEKSS